MTTVLEVIKLLGKESVIKSNSFKAAVVYILSLFLNTASDEADVTSLGRPFHTFAPATGKARSPTVDRRQVGTSSRSVEADPSLRRCIMSVTHVNDDAKYGGACMQSTVRQHRHRECNSL